MDVGVLLRADGRLPDIFAASRRFIVVAQEHPRFVRQGKQFLDGIVERSSIAAREITAGGSEIRHENRIANKEGVSDQVAHAGRRMAGRVDRPGFQTADLVGLAILEQMIELAAIGVEGLTLVEDPCKDFLDGRDMRADPGFTAQFPLDMRRCRQVVRVHVRVDDPLTCQSVRTNESNHLVGRVGFGAARGLVEVQQGIDYGADLCFGVGDDIADCIRCFIEEAGNHGLVHLWVLFISRNRAGKNAVSAGAMRLLGRARGLFLGQAFRLAEHDGADGIHHFPKTRRVRQLIEYDFGFPPGFHETFLAEFAQFAGQTRLLDPECLFHVAHRHFPVFELAADHQPGRVSESLQQGRRLVSKRCEICGVRRHVAPPILYNTRRRRRSARADRPLPGQSAEAARSGHRAPNLRGSQPDCGQKPGAH